MHFCNIDTIFVLNKIYFDSEVQCVSSIVSSSFVLAMIGGKLSTGNFYSFYKALILYRIMYEMFSVNIVSVLVTYSDIEKLFVVLQCCSIVDLKIEIKLYFLNSDQSLTVIQMKQLHCQIVSEYI